MINSPHLDILDALGDTVELLVQADQLGVELARQLLPNLAHLVLIQSIRKIEKGWGKERVKFIHKL